jgi:hypothetical protein
MTDADGKPINGEKQHLNPGDDARLKACRLVRQRRNSRITHRLQRQAELSAAQILGNIRYLQGWCRSWSSGEVLRDVRPRSAV